MRGHLITIEGVDYSGKTTQSNILMKNLHSLGYSVACFSSPIDNDLRAIAKTIGDNSLCPPATRLHLYCAANSKDTLIVAEALKKNDFVIIDRWIDSTIAYHFELVKFSYLNVSLDDLKFIVTKFIQIPDFTILLEVPIDIVAKRFHFYSCNGLSKTDAFIEKDSMLIKRVQMTLLMLAEMEPNRFLKLSVNDEPIDQVANKILIEVLEKFKTNKL